MSPKQQASNCLKMLTRQLIARRQNPTLEEMGLAVTCLPLADIGPEILPLITAAFESVLFERAKKVVFARNAKRPGYDDQMKLVQQRLQKKAELGENAEQLVVRVLGISHLKAMGENGKHIVPEIAMTILMKFATTVIADLSKQPELNSNGLTVPMQSVEPDDEPKWDLEQFLLANPEFQSNLDQYVHLHPDEWRTESFKFFMKQLIPGWTTTIGRTYTKAAKVAIREIVLKTFESVQPTPMSQGPQGPDKKQGKRQGKRNFLAKYPDFEGRLRHLMRQEFTWRTYTDLVSKLIPEWTTAKIFLIYKNSVTKMIKTMVDDARSKVQLMDVTAAKGVQPTPMDEDSKEGPSKSPSKSPRRSRSKSPRGCGTTRSRSRSQSPEKGIAYYQKLSNGGKLSNGKPKGNKYDYTVLQSKGCLLITTWCDERKLKFHNAVRSLKAMGDFVNQYLTDEERPHKVTWDVVGDVLTQRQIGTLQIVQRSVKPKCDSAGGPVPTKPDAKQPKVKKSKTSEQLNTSEQLITGIDIFPAFGSDANMPLIQCSPPLKAPTWDEVFAKLTAYPDALYIPMFRDNGFETPAAVAQLPVQRALDLMKEIGIKPGHRDSILAVCGMLHEQYMTAQQTPCLMATPGPNFKRKLRDDDFVHLPGVGVTPESILTSAVVATASQYGVPMAQVFTGTQKSEDILLEVTVVTNTCMNDTAASPTNKVTKASRTQVVALFKQAGLSYKGCNTVEEMCDMIENYPGPWYALTQDTELCAKFLAGEEKPAVQPVLQNSSQLSLVNPGKRSLAEPAPGMMWVPRTTGRTDARYLWRGTDARKSAAAMKCFLQEKLIKGTDVNSVDIEWCSNNVIELPPGSEVIFTPGKPGTVHWKQVPDTKSK